MDERRRQERFTHLYPSEVRDRQTDQVVGLVADASSGGLLLRAQTALTPGETLQLMVELPPGQEPRALPAEARVRWCEPDLAPATFVIGLAFTGSTRPDGPAAMELMRALKHGA
jgi:hypothetical protein